MCAMEFLNVDMVFLRAGKEFQTFAMDSFALAFLGFVMGFAVNAMDLLGWLLVLEVMLSFSLAYFWVS